VKQHESNTADGEQRSDPVISKISEHLWVRRLRWWAVSSLVGAIRLRLPEPAPNAVHTLPIVRVTLGVSAAKVLVPGRDGYCRYASQTEHWHDDTIR
jgi:hypothetical protein